MPPDAAQTDRKTTLPRATYTVAEAAAVLGIPRRTLYVYIAQGVVPAVHIGRRKLLILQGTIEQLLAAGAFPGPPAAALTEF
jgi:excisionase family DNA binding protein